MTRQGAGVVRQRERRRKRAALRTLDTDGRMRAPDIDPDTGEPIVHGTLNTYHGWVCRCVPCVEGKSSRDRARYRTMLDTPIAVPVNPPETYEFTNWRMLANCAQRPLADSDPDTVRAGCSHHGAVETLTRHARNLCYGCPVARECGEQALDQRLVDVFACHEYISPAAPQWGRQRIARHLGRTTT